MHHRQSIVGGPVQCGASEGLGEFLYHIVIYFSCIFQQEEIPHENV